MTVRHFNNNIKVLAECQLMPGSSGPVSA